MWRRSGRSGRLRPMAEGSCGRWMLLDWRWRPTLSRRIWRRRGGGSGGGGDWPTFLSLTLSLFPGFCWLHSSLFQAAFCGAMLSEWCCASASAVRNCMCCSLCVCYRLFVVSQFVCTICRFAHALCCRFMFLRFRVLGPILLWCLHAQ